MTVEVLPISRARRELNRVMRRLRKREVDVYEVPRRGREYVYIVSCETYDRLVERFARYQALVEKLDAKSQATKDGEESGSADDQGPPA